MDQILSVLISRACVDAEEAQRQLAGALNGLAALLWLSQQQQQAVAAYREVLALPQASKGGVRLDSFQLLHTLHNLAELLAELARKQQRGSSSSQQQQQQQGQRGASTAAGAAAAGTSGPGTGGGPGQDLDHDPDPEPYGPGVSRTLRDDTLISEAAAIREQYLAQRQAELATAYQAYKKAAADALPAGLRGSKHSRQRQQGAAAAGGSRGASAAAAASGGGSRGAGRKEGLLDELMPSDGEAASDDAEDDGGGGTGADVGSSVGEGWWVSVIDALKAVGAQEAAADAIREKLRELDTYKKQVRAGTVGSGAV